MGNEIDDWFAAQSAKPKPTGKAPGSFQGVPGPLPAIPNRKGPSGKVTAEEVLNRIFHPSMGYIERKKLRRRPNLMKFIFDEIKKEHIASGGYKDDQQLWAELGGTHGLTEMIRPYADAFGLGVEERRIDTWPNALPTNSDRQLGEEMAKKQLERATGIKPKNRPMPELLRDMMTQPSPKNLSEAQTSMDEFAAATAQEISSGKPEEPSIASGWTAFRQWMTRDHAAPFAMLHDLLPQEMKMKLKTRDLTKVNISPADAAWINGWLKNSGLQTFPTWLLTPMRISMAKFKAAVAANMVREPAMAKAWLNANCRFAQ